MTVTIPWQTTCCTYWSAAGFSNVACWHLNCRGSHTPLLLLFTCVAETLTCQNPSSPSLSWARSWTLPSLLCSQLGVTVLFGRASWNVCHLPAQPVNNFHLWDSLFFPHPTDKWKRRVKQHRRSHINLNMLNGTQYLDSLSRLKCEKALIMWGRWDFRVCCTSLPWWIQWLSHTA